MPLKANIGLSKKVGLPDYGSMGASCNIEVELDSSLIENQPAVFQGHVQSIYQACREPVEAQLAGQKPKDVSHLVLSPQATTNGNHVTEQSNGTNRFQASEKQLSYIQQLATQINLQ